MLRVVNSPMNIYVQNKWQYKTRKLSSRMHTDDWMCFNSHQISAMMVDSQVNKFEQVSSLDRQISIVSIYCWGPCTEGSLWRRRSLHGDVQCIMGNGHMGPQPLPCEENDWLMDRPAWKHYLQPYLLAGGKLFLPWKSVRTDDDGLCLTQFATYISLFWSGL